MTKSCLRKSSFYALAVLIAFAAISPVVAAEMLRIGGTGSATVLMERLGAAFAARESDVKVAVVPGLGSSGAIAATIDGALDMAVSGRPLKPDEAGLIEVFAVRTPYGLVSSNPKPGDLARDDVAGFYASSNSTWSDGSPVRVILRPRSESDTTLLGQTFPGMAAAIDQVRTRMDVPLAATDQDNLEMAKAIQGSLVGTSLAQMVTERHQLRFLTIDGVEPTLENLESGDYPYFKPLRFVVADRPAPLVQRFLAFVESSDGEKLLRHAGCLQAAR